MNRAGLILRGLVLGVLLALPTVGSSDQSATVQSIVEGAPEVDANTFLLVDFQSGEELVSYNAGKAFEPASITKLMTAYILYSDLSEGKIQLSDEVLISQKAWEMRGSRMFVEAGSKVRLEHLLRGLIIQSGNDAAVALAEHVSGNEPSFVDRMNSTAKKLGMMDTQFQNSTGWPAENHYTTARDIVRLTRALISQFPQRYKLYSEKEYTYNDIKQNNRNKLLWRDKTVDGVKTGHTESAGYCLVASAKRDNMRLISVVLGAGSEESRADSSQRLLEFGFKNVETHKLYSAGDVLSEVRVWKGHKKTVAAGVSEDLYVSMGKGKYDKLKGIVQFDKSIDAPIARGDVLGKVVLSDDTRVLKQIPLLALEPVEPGNFWRRITDTVSKIFDE